jgi:hypothetical protein
MWSSNTDVGEMLSWRIAVSLPLLSAASLIVWIVGGLVADHGVHLRAGQLDPHRTTHGAGGYACHERVARAVLRHLERRPAATSSWLARLVARRNHNVAAVALAKKNARIAWALLAHQFAK